jgi:hypothetical protein
MLIVTLLVNGMPTWHEHNSLGRCKEKIATYGTIAFRIAFNTTMRA